MGKTEEKYLLIGAGPCGLGVANGLQEASIPFEHVEATDHVGGNWAHGVYETAHIISSKKTTEYPDYPMPESYPDFPSAQQMNDYYNDYARKKGLYSTILFEKKVVLVEPKAGGKWACQFEDGESKTYAGVIVCNGHHWDKSFPSWVEDYEGEVIHTKDYKSPDMLKDKKVLVLGGGNSGCDLVSEAARVGKRAEWSLRRGYWFFPKTFFGKPTVEMVRPYMPLFLQRIVLSMLIRITVGKYEDYGLPRPSHKIFEAHPTVSNEIFHYLKHGRIHVRPDVSRVEGKTIYFADGTSEEYDLVVCGTGYKVSFPFLPEGMVAVEGKVAKLYAGLLHEKHKNLYVFGTSQVRYGVGPLIRPGAIFLSKLIRLQEECELPLGKVFKEMGQKPPTTHLIDPFFAIKQMKRAPLFFPLIRKKEKKLREQKPLTNG